MKKATADIIRKSGLKVTNSRISVLSLLINAGSPLSIDEIKKKIGNSADIVTVYRILQKFVEKAIVYQTDFRDGKSYFEFQKNHHHHIVCTSCGKKEEVEVCVETQTKKAIIGSKKFAHIQSHILEFFGTCKTCHN